MKKFRNLLPVLVIFLFCTSCIDNDQDLTYEYYEDYELMENVLNIPNDSPMDYTLEFPEYYGRNATFNANMATLGRVMFYDTNLSADRTISCASCHKQELAFSDDKVVSDGIFDEVTDRNSLALGAVFNFQEYYGTASISAVPFFWDNSIRTVQEQIVMTFGSEKEMDMTIDQVVDVMNSNDYYRPLIKANNMDKITNAAAVEALAVFVNSIGSYGSKFDKELSATAGGRIGFGQSREIATRTFNGFTANENRGKDIYMNNCASCHGELMGAPNELQANNGLLINDGDFGVPGSLGQFKVPSLRNLTLTYPYMHDGRFATIEDVIEHYSTGIQMNPALHNNLKDNSGNAMAMNFTDGEKEDLIAFLKTFDDEEFLTNPIYSDPFIR